MYFGLLISPILLGYPNGKCWIGMADWAVLLGRIGSARSDGLSCWAGLLSGMGYPRGADFPSG